MQKDKTILITGGTGFVGSHLLEYLQEIGCENIHLTTYNEPSAFFTERLSQNHLHTIDLTDLPATQKLLEVVAPDYIFHLASLSAVGSSFENAEHVLSNNIQLQHTVLQAVRTTCPEARVLSVGSADTYGVSLPGEVPIAEDHVLRPVSPYAVSKASQDLLAGYFAFSHKLNIVRVRPFNHIGERQVAQFAVPAFSKQIVAVERGEQSEIFVGNLSAVRDFTDVRDMVKAYSVLMEAGAAGEAYNVGSGSGVTMQSVLDMLCDLSSADISVVQDAERMRPLDIPEMIADNTKIRSLGWQPEISLKKSLERIITYWRNQ